MLHNVEKANRINSKLRIALIGPSGSGKTYSALKMGLALGKKVGVIDTEYKSAKLYSGLGDYYVIEFTPPYLISEYITAISILENDGCDVIIIDSLSHAWAGEGGLLDKHALISNKVHNSFTAWRQITPEHTKLINAILSSKAHIIATMRAKTEYAITENDKGKQQPVKLGLAPIQRDGIEFEFTTIFDIDMQHVASVNKDRTGIFSGRYFTINEDTAKELLEWCSSGLDPKDYAKQIIDKFCDEAKDVATLDALQKSFGKAYKSLSDPEHQEVVTEIYNSFKSKLTTK